MCAAVYDRLLADYGVFDDRALLDLRAGHEHRIEHLCALFDHCRRRENGVFDMTLDLAALGDDRMHDRCFRADIVRRLRDAS